MPILSDPRHERFAQNLAAGMSQVEAYAKAGYKRDRRDASKLAAKPDISRRVAELQAAGAAKVVSALFDAARMLRETAEAGLTVAKATPVGDYRGLVGGAVEALKLAEVLSGGVSDRTETRSTDALDEIEGRLARFDTEARAGQNPPKPH